MTEWLFDCQGCCDYKLATLCGSDPDAPTVYVYANSVPAGTTTFRYWDWCYQVDSASPNTMIPKPSPGADAPHKVSLMVGGTYFADCADCAANSDLEDSQPGGVYGGGGGGGGGWGWWWPGYTADDYNPHAWEEYILATVCSGYPQMDRAPLYVVADSVPAGGTVFRWLNVCYAVDERAGDDSNVVAYEDLPEQRYTVYLNPNSTYYASCSECRAGVQADLCPGQASIAGYADLPEFWVPADRLPDTDVVFVFEGFCWHLDVNKAPADMPHDQVIASPGTDYASCNDCGWGYMCSLCPDQDYTSQAPAVWVREDNAPGEGEDYIFRVETWCYRINGDDLPEKRLIPPGVEVVVPHSQFQTCGDCICGIADEFPCGVKAQVCYPQAYDPSLVRDYWVKCDDVPDKWIIFKRHGVCYSLSSATAPRPVPAGGIIIDPVGQYGSCSECLESYQPDPDPPWPPQPPDEPDSQENPEPPEPDPEPVPPDPPPFVAPLRFRQALDCLTKSWQSESGDYLPVFPIDGATISQRLPTVVRVGCTCYLLAGPASNQPLRGPLMHMGQVDEIYNNAQPCETCWTSCVNCQDCIAHAHDITAWIHTDCTDPDCAAESEHAVSMSAPTSGCDWSATYVNQELGDTTIQLTCAKTPDETPPHQWRFNVTWTSRDPNCPGGSGAATARIIPNEDGYPETPPGEYITVEAGPCTFHVWLEAPTLP